MFKSIRYRSAWMICSVCDVSCSPSRPLRAPSLHSTWIDLKGAGYKRVARMTARERISKIWPSVFD